MNLEKNNLPQQFVGTVQSHRGRGRILGVPTVNITGASWPPEGVYAGYVWLQAQRYQAAIFVGAAITFNETQPQLEAHILDFSGDVVGQSITLELVTWVRANQRFASAQALQKQMQKDIQQVRQCLPA